MEDITNSAGEALSCPNCGEEVDKDFCSNCGKGVDVAIQMKARTNLGNMTAIDADIIHGPVNINHLYQVQVFAQQERKQRGAWPIPEKPYKSYLPYSVSDDIIFKGRGEEIKQVVTLIGDHSKSVVTGKTGVGKTSLLLAGIIPQLIQEGALGVHIQDYHDPFTTIREALRVSELKLSDDTFELATLQEFIVKLVEESGGTFVLIMDQFERVFDPSIPDAIRIALAVALAETLEIVGTECFRIVIGIRDYAFEQLDEFREDLPDLGHESISLKPFTRDQAENAILEPLESPDYRVIIDPDLTTDFIVPELDELTTDRPGEIHPWQLQIVCDHLYREARIETPPLVNEKFYKDQGRVEGIMASYKVAALKRQFGGDWEQAQSVLEEVASPGRAEWITAFDLKMDDVEVEQVEETLNKLTENDWLISREIEERVEFAYGSESLKGEIYRTASPELTRRYRAEGAIKRIWDAWLVREVHASEGQLKYLSRYGLHLDSPPITQSLLLLRSATHRNQDVVPWIPWVKARKEWILYLEGADEVPQPRDWTLALETESKKILGLSEGKTEDSSSDQNNPVGRITATSVSNKDATVRRTAALALVAADKGKAIDGIYDALEDLIPQVWVQRWRKAELLSVLVEADPDVERNISRLRWRDKLITWIHRSGRRIIRNWREIVWKIYGAAIGAGLGLGFFRVITAALLRHNVGPPFSSNFFHAIVLGIFLTSGIALTDILLTKRTKATETTPSLWRTPFHPDRIAKFLKVVFGTLGFGVAHIIVGWFDAGPLRPKTLFWTMGLVAGFGLSAAISSQLQEEGRSSNIRWIGRFLTSASFLALTQLAYILFPGNGTSIAIVWAGGTYSSDFKYLLDRYWPTLPDILPRWFDVFALIDAALVGIILTIGLVVGLRIAKLSRAKYEDLISRSED